MMNNDSEQTEYARRLLFVKAKTPAKRLRVRVGNQFSKLPNFFSASFYHCDNNMIQDNRE